MNAHSLSSPPTAIERRLTAAARRPIRVLLIDDHPTVLAGLAGVLDDDPGITAAATATSARDGLAQARRLVLDAVVVDYYLPGEDGLWLVPRLKALHPSPGVVLYSVYACPAMTVAAILAGADGVLSKALAPKSSATRSALSPMGERRCRRSRPQRCSRSPSSIPPTPACPA